MEYIRIAAGTLLMAFAINCAFVPADLVTGGFSGLAIVIRDLAGLPIWLMSALLNVPLFFAAIWKKGFRFVSKALFGAAALSVFLAAVPELSVTGGDVFLSALFGGVFQGAGLGLVFSAGGTTGGTDMMAVLLKGALPAFSAAQILQVLDGLVVLTGAGVFGLQKALYAVVAIVITARVTDMLLEGLNFAKAAYIISDHAEEIAESLLHKLARGVTGIPARGMYSGVRRDMLFCTVGKKQIHALKEFVSEIDPEAFMIILDAREVLGEGFSGNQQV